MTYASANLQIARTSPSWRTSCRPGCAGPCRGLHGSADGQAVLGERALGAAVDDLQEQLTHGGVDGVADEVGVQSFEDGLADEDLRSHGGGMRHAGAADGLDESFLDDAVLHVEGELAGALLRRAPTDTMRKPEMSLISFAWTHLPSSGMGAGPWYAPFATGHICCTSVV